MAFSTRSETLLGQVGDNWV